MKFIIASIMLMCLWGCSLSATPMPEMNMSTATPTLNQGFTGHVYTYYTGPAPLCDTAGGGNCQTLINNALREYITNQQEPIEVILRRVVREELQSAAQ